MVRSRIGLLLLTVLWACGGDTGTDPDQGAGAGGDEENGPAMMDAPTTIAQATQPNRSPVCPFEAVNLTTSQAP